MEYKERIEQIKDILVSDKKKKKRKVDKEETRERSYRAWQIKMVKKGMNSPYMGLYIHIPFCQRKCDYCDFVSYPMDENSQRAYLDALKKEIDMVAREHVTDEFNTLYIGGGTPSFVFDGFIKDLTRKIFSSFHFVGDVEFTIEINPASITEKKLLEYMESGCNRISIGVQCLDGNILKNLGRIQTVENIDNTFNLLHKMKFLNIGADVMIGLPKQTMSSVKETIEYLLKQNVKHISVYSLQVEEGTPLYEQVQAGKVKPLDDEECTNMYNMIYKMLKDEEYIRYEVSNFSKPGFESRQNFKYWNDIRFLGLGVSAHSYVGNYRFSNTKDLDEYIKLLDEGKLPIENKEFLSFQDRRTERIMLSLRLETGLDLEKFKRDFNEDLLRSRADVISDFLDMGLVEFEEGNLKITENNFYLSNRVILELI